MDREIAAMAKVAEALGDLDEAAAERVLRWAADRFEVRDIDTVRDPRDADDSSGDGGSNTPNFEHFADLFAAARPHTNEDKALVAGYWVQVIEGSGTWASRQLNRELRNLGHALPNIADALNSAIGRKPQRVLQLSKSGKSQQANKTYKLSAEGVRHVEALVQGGA